MPSLSMLRDELRRLEHEASIFDGLTTGDSLSHEQREKLSQIRERIRSVQQMLSVRDGEQA